MKGTFRITAAVMVMFVVSVPTTAQPSSTDNDQAIRTEVNAFMDRYWELFSAGRIDQLVEQVYDASGQLSNQGHSSIQELRMRFPDTRKALIAGGYGKSHAGPQHLRAESNRCDRERSRLSISDRRSCDGRIRMDVHPDPGPCGMANGFHLFP
jgi:hypothetical protein